MRYKILFYLLTISLSINSQDTFEPLDVYDLEFATDPQVAPDGKQIVYVRSFMDVMTDSRLSNLWITNFEGNRHRPLTSGNVNHYSPIWSPDGSKIAFISTESGKAQVHMLWTDNGQSSKITNLQKSPSGLKWSPDGKWLIFNMRVKADKKSFGSAMDKPEGADWAEAPKYIDRLIYRSDGAGYVDESYTHIFIMPAEGGTPRQLTSGEFNHSSASFSPDGMTLYFSSNQQEDWEYNQRNTEIFSMDMTSQKVTALTDRYGPDYSPQVSPDGKRIAYLGYDDKKLGSQNTHLYIMSVDGNNIQQLSSDLDISIGNINWDRNSRGLYFQYDEKGNSKVGHIALNGNMKNIANNLGGSSIGRPYSGGYYDVNNGNIVFTQTSPTQPSEIAVLTKAFSKPRKITSLNEDILVNKNLATVEEIWYKSSHDDLDIQGWIMKPPAFDATKKYPLLLEIHGGPHTNYGDRFSPELQLMASKGYVVLYTNPRGSTSYGEDFSNLIQHDYPGNDYFDLMSGVDAVIEKGYIDEERLFITGGSGGGVLTSWAIGKTDRFAAAVVAKPVINWYSWALTADIAGVVEYWFPSMPWEDPEHYMKRSPISLVGNVTTPTMLLTGEQDYRTPMSESEQYYQALKMRKIPSALVRIQEASHGIASKPSNLLAKVNYITSWFKEYDKDVENSKP